MKKIYFLLFTLLMTAASFGQDLVITGVYDAGLSGGTPKGIELYVIADIADLSVYGIGSANNGGGTDGEEFTFPAVSAMAGQFIYLSSEATQFTNFFGFAPDYTDGSMGINGDDAVELFQNGSVVDTFGDIGTDGNGEPWEYTDGWAYRLDSTGPDGGFVLGNWTFSGINAFDGETTNSAAATPMPIGTYSAVAPTSPEITITSPIDMAEIDSGTTSVDLEWNILAGNGTETVTVTVNGNVLSMDASSPFPIPTTDGETYNVDVQLIDGGLLDSDSVSFSVLFPCTLTIGEITATCDSVNDGPGDFYTAEIAFDNAGNSDYTIDTGGVGTVDDGMIDTMTSGTITITDIPENTNLTVTFTGDSADSGCNFTRFIGSPICDPQLELPFTENFEYGTTAGDLTVVSSGDWENHSGNTAEAVQYSENSLVLDNYDARASFGGSAIVDPANSEDVNLPFAEQTSGTIYASSLMNISAATGNNYFFHLRGGGFVARVAAQDDGAGGINFGVGASGNAVFGSTSYALNTTYLVVVAFNIDSGLTNLYVLTSPTGTEPSTPEATDTGGSGTAISSVALRQSGGIANATIDGIRVAKTWANLSLSNNDFETRSFSIFPNPTNTGEVTIASVNAAPIAVTVFDMLGKQVKNETISNNRLNVSNLKSGIYLLNITQEGATSTKKLVIK